MKSNLRYWGLRLSWSKSLRYMLNLPGDMNHVGLITQCLIEIWVLQNSGDVYTIRSASIAIEKKYFVVANCRQVNWVEVLPVYVILRTLLGYFDWFMTPINSTYHGWKPSVHPETVHDHLSSFLGRSHNNLARNIIFHNSANLINTRKHGAFCYHESIGDRFNLFLVSNSEQPQFYQQGLSYRYWLSTPVLWTLWSFWTVAKVLDKLFKGFRRKTKMTAKLTNRS